ncbi:MULTISPECIES: response regulator [unclassified Coleofasciculus]|uniref:response regulator n=1 Tax=unclassified Coleofasciculus TaxID=2692782 RepID=UPI00187F97A6|nr:MULTISPECIES: response regulator [unclassified Coleofasciculus]MBE9126450.1 response regulator [Coleofasciculus sp. LEGE 07081]MBE9148052.1 response regulator [Coleofasciculus sp. LEGE 07092]
MSAKHLLVIDDETNLCSVIQACLETLGGWNVVTAETGKEGLLKAETYQPDAILLDIMMPDMDGITLFQTLQQNPVTQHIPVVLLTAKVLTDDLAQFNELGITGVIAKPFDPLRLIQQVRELLNW